MNFKLWEATYSGLYTSTERAFPHTTARQHLSSTIGISEIKITPFVGVKTFLVRATATNEDRQYHPLILFKGVVYREGPDEGVKRLRISPSEVRYIEELTDDEHDILVRCQCMDEYWRFRHYNKIGKSLYGKDRKKYESQGGPAANPSKRPGVCKHIIALMEKLQERGLVI